MSEDDRRVGPMIVRRRLGAELRRLREDANLRLEAVAYELEASASKISRIETGHSTAKLWDVRNLLTLYGVTDEQRRGEILGWAADAKAQAWWQDDIASLSHEAPNYYMSLEAEARSIQCYSTPVLHALLQTEDYARAHLASIVPDLDDEAIDRQVRVRTMRRSVLLEDVPSFRLLIVIDEAALYRRVGSEEIMRDQIRALLASPETVELRVRTFAAGAHTAALSPFTIFTPRVADLDPVVVAVEAALSDSYLERPEDVARYQVAFHELRDSALDPDASRDLFRSLIP